MTWNDAYAKDREPTLAGIDAFVGTKPWTELRSHLEREYASKPKIAHSSCGMMPGWNVKYAKGGKSLATLYPEGGYFRAMVVLGGPGLTEAEAMAAGFTAPVQEMLKRPVAWDGLQWMMIEVRGAEDLEDVQQLVALRRKYK